MKRFSATLLSIGLSAALVAVGIWFLSSPHGLYRWGSGRWSMPYGGGGMMAGGFGGGTGVVMILFWVIVMIALVLLISGVIARHGSGSTDDSFRSEPDALEILKRRYANGEIDRSEFETKRKVLQQ